MSLKDPRERLARWVLEVQDFDFTVEHRESKALVVPDTLSRDAVPKPLCQRCYRPLSDEKMEDALEHAEKVSAVVEVESFSDGPAFEDLYAQQVAEFGNLERYAEDKESFIVDDEGLLRKVRNGSLAVVVPKDLKQSILKHAHGSSLTSHYGTTRTLQRLVGK